MILFIHGLVGAKTDNCRMTTPPCTEAVKMFSPFFSELCNSIKTLIINSSTVVSRKIVSLKTSRPDQTLGLLPQEIWTHNCLVFSGGSTSAEWAQNILFLTQEIRSHNFLVDCPSILSPAWSADWAEIFLLCCTAPSITHNNNPDTQLPFKKARLSAALLAICPTFKCTGCFLTLGLPLKYQSTDKLI